MGSKGAAIWAARVRRWRSVREWAYCTTIAAALAGPLNMFMPTPAWTAWVVLGTSTLAFAVHWLACEREDRCAFFALIADAKERYGSGPCSNPRCRICRG